MKTFAAAVALATASTIVLPASPLFAQDAAEAPATPDWVETSNGYTQKVIAMQAGFFPTGASSAGYEEYDGLVNDMSLDRNERYVEAARALIDEFEAAKVSEARAIASDMDRGWISKTSSFKIASLLNFPRCRRACSAISASSFLNRPPRAAVQRRLNCCNATLEFGRTQSR